MPPQKVLFCGTNAPLLQSLQLNAGYTFQVEQVPESTFFQPLHLDVGMLVVQHEPPRMDGLPTLRQFKRENPEVPVLVVTSDYSGHTTKLLLKSGAEEVLPLGAPEGDLLACYEAYLPGFKLAPLKPKTKSGKTNKVLMAALAPSLLAAANQSTVVASPPAPLPALPPIVQDREIVYKGLEINFFGFFAARRNGKKIELTNQAKLLFAYLAYNYPKPTSRDHLARVFWSEKYEYKPESARRSLNVELTHIRNAFRAQTGVADDIVVFDKNAYRLQLTHELESDVLKFKQLGQKIQDLQRAGQPVPDEVFQEAIQTYAGNFLEDFAAETLNWIEVERQHLSAVFERIADQYSAQLCAQNDYWKAVAVCNDILSRDVRMEVIHRRAMLCYAELGMLHKVEQQYLLCCRMMRQEFQSKPSTETIRLYDEITKNAKK
jgi:DNA-binding SARP family transcriptional activator/DNA-binding NarL/FixJ family response regulator